MFGLAPVSSNATIRTRRGAPDVNGEHGTNSNTGSFRGSEDLRQDPRQRKGIGSLDAVGRQALW